jgi:hypothetical protein
VLAGDAGTAANQRAKELLDLIARKKAQIVEGFYEIGLALREIKQKKLYASLGYASFAAMLAGHNVMGHSQAGKLVEIVSAMTRSQALVLGIEKAYAAARLADATPEADTVGTLLESGVKTGANDRGRKNLTRMTLREIDAEARAARKKARPKSEEEKSADQDARRARSALTKAGFRVIESTATHHAKQWRVRIVAVPQSRA